MKYCAPAGGVCGVPLGLVSCAMGLALSTLSVQLPGTFQGVFNGIGFVRRPGARNVTLSEAARVVLNAHFGEAPLHTPFSGASFQSFTGVSATATFFPAGT